MPHNSPLSTGASEPHIFTAEGVVRVLRREVFRHAIVFLYTAGLRRGELI